MRESTTRILAGGLKRGADPSSGVSESVLSISDVAQLLSCSVDDAMGFLEQEAVPALNLPSGSYRFLASSVLEAVRKSLRPYTRAKAEKLEEDITRAWEGWVVSRGDQVVKNLNGEWRAWVCLMCAERTMPDEFFNMELKRRRKLVAKIGSMAKALPFNISGEPDPAPALPQCVSTTTRIRGSFTGRKAFEGLEAVRSID